MADSAIAETLCSPRRLVIGIGELAVSNSPGDVIVTHALGSCIAVCVFDPVALVAGMLHFLLPEASINPERARQQPAVFADTGIPLLFQTAYQYGLVKRRAIVKLVGGAEMQTTGAAFNTGRRNALAAKNLLWRNERVRVGPGDWRHRRPDAAPVGRERPATTLQRPHV